MGCIVRGVTESRSGLSQVSDKPLSSETSGMSQQGGHCGREEEKKDTCSSWGQMDRRSSLWHGDEGGTISGIRKRGISNVILFVCKPQRLLVGQVICLSLEPFFFPYCDFLN